MPICTTCTTPVQYLYTVYQSGNNLRLEQCSKCLSFADPYVEYDTLTLLLDLILLKRGVYRHLLFNRGTPPKRETVGGTDKAAKSKDESWTENQDHKRWKAVALLAATLILIDAFIRWSEHYSFVKADDESANVASWNTEAGRLFVQTLLGCCTETISFHIGVIFFSLIANRLLNALAQSPPSSIRGEFRTSRISLSLLYSSLTKLFLLLTLSIWPAGSAPSDSQALPPPRMNYSSPLLNSVLEFLDEDKLDRHWVVRNVLGGIAAGFGLRVVLDCHPLITAFIIMGGWWFKTFVLGLTSQWLGTEGAWLAYSIP